MHTYIAMTEQDASSANGADDQSSTLSKELLCASNDGDLHKVKQSKCSRLTGLL